MYYGIYLGVPVFTPEQFFVPQCGEMTVVEMIQRWNPSTNSHRPGFPAVGCLCLKVLFREPEKTKNYQNYIISFKWPFLLSRKVP